MEQSDELLNLNTFENGQIFLRISSLNSFKSQEIVQMWILKLKSINLQEHTYRPRPHEDDCKRKR